MSDLATSSTPGLVPSLDDIRAREAAHLLTIRAHDQDSRLIIVNYTPRVQFGRLWDDVTMACRGLVLRVDRPWPDASRIEEVVALPFAKFFNVGETGEWPSSPITEITEKLDGALAILFRLSGKYAIATRGSFHSPQAQWATRFLRQNHRLADLPDDLTLLFEIISPVSRVVVDYKGDERLVLLGVRNRVTGEDALFQGVREVAMRWDLPLVPTETSFADVDTAMRRRADLGADREGWVIRCADGRRWKVKGTLYAEIHRVLSHLSERATIDAMQAGTIDGILARIPFEYRERVEGWRKDAEQALADGETYLRATFDDGPKETRKDFALWAKAHHPADMPFLFALLDGKPIRPMLFEKLREKASPWPLVRPDA